MFHPCSDDEETDVSESQKETAFNLENSETSFENKSIGQRTAKQKVKVLLSRKSRYCQSKIE
ncbi:hypothetical protein Tco_0772347, partial [Tanacetum coccineum]